MSISSINYLKKFKTPSKPMRGVRIKENGFFQLISQGDPKKIDYGKIQDLDIDPQVSPESINPLNQLLVELSKSESRQAK
jgi:hypothetical protein